MSRSPFRDVPPPGTSLETMRVSIEALKENMEILQGLRGKRGISSQVFYVDPKNSTEVPEGNNNGDLWIQSPLEPGGQRRISIWQAGKWVS